MDDLDKIIKEINSMFSNRTILHCEDCHHEQDSCLGSKCNWCGGNMVPMKNVK